MEKENKMRKRCASTSTGCGKCGRSRRGSRSLVEVLESRVMLSTVAFWEGKLSSIQLPSHETSLDARNTVIADFNGDGINDIVVQQQRQIGFGNNYIGVLLNKGNGTFTPVVHYATSPGARGMVHGDFDHDGHEDLAALTESQLQIFFNPGNGQFAAPVNYATTGATHITVGDFTVDGNVDLAVLNNDAQATDIFVNLGNGSFTKVTHPGMFATAAADMNGDGWIDLVGSSDLTATATFRVYLNDGSGGFAIHVDSAIAPGDLVADLNGDSRPDAVVYGGEDILRVAVNNGSGLLMPGAAYWQPLLIDTTFADMNGDGKLDLVTTSFPDKVNVRLGAGDATFGMPQSIFLPYNATLFQGYNPALFQPAGTDLNGDGAPDLVAEVNADGTNALAVMLNRNTSARHTGITMIQSSLHSQVRQSVAFTARVWTDNGDPATGNVRFTVDGVTWAAVPVKNGVAQFQTSALGATFWPPNKSFHTVQAVYDGDATFAGSSSQHVKHAVSGQSLPNLYLPTGHVDALSAQVVKGWSVDSDAPRAWVEVKVTVDGANVGSATANEPRTDLVRRYGSADHGFTFVMPTLTSGSHGVRVYAVDGRSRQLRLLLTRTVAVP